MLTIEAAAYTAFLQQYNAGAYGGQRLGQAFYNCFNLHKLSDQAQLKGLYEREGEVAKALIQELFEFH